MLFYMSLVEAQLAKMNLTFTCTHTYANDLKMNTGSGMAHSEMKSLVAILKGLIQYIEILLGCYFYLMIVGMF